jgi:hypothetical protein
VIEAYVKLKPAEPATASAGPVEPPPIWVAMRGLHD